MSSKLCLIDGSSLLYRSFYGVRPLSTSAGVPTHAIYGMCRTLKKLIDELQPTHMVLVWDTKGPTFRHETFTEYKATRQAPPSDLLTQKKAIMTFADTVGITQISKQGYEADDLLYALATDKLCEETIVVTGDKDLHQMLTPEISIYDPFKRKIITAESFEEERGFAPKHLMLYHSLLGDASDNIPGVKGVGKKTAEVLTQQYHTLDNLYEHLDELKPRHAKLLTESKENAYLSKQLFTLAYIETGLSLSNCALDTNKWREAAPFFQKHEITPFFPKGVSAPVATPAPQASGNNQLSLFATIEQEAPPVLDWKATCVTTREALDALVEAIRKEMDPRLRGDDGVLAIDTETNGLRPLQDAVVGISLAYTNKEAFYIPFGHTTDEQQLSREEVLETLKPTLEDANIPKCLHNAKFDQLGFAQYGIRLAGIRFDSLIAAFLLRKGNEKIGLKAASVRYLNEEMLSFAQLAKQYKLFSNVPLEQATLYAAHDARQTLMLHDVLKPQIDANETFAKLLYDVELPLADLLFDMETTGIILDESQLSSLKEAVKEQIDRTVAKLATCMEADEHHIDISTVNLNSPKQLEVLLFDQLQLPSIKKSPKTGKRSTDSEVLNELSKIHPAPALIIQYRELAKLLNTYLEALPHEINPYSKRVHTTYSQTIAATGRLSSSQPNLQNIPVGSGMGSKVRDAFVAPKGHVFLSADYSQIELRILAHYTQDPALLAAFKEGRDIHAQTAAQIFDITPEEVTNDQRQVGKKINFSIMYGLTPFGLSKDLGIKPGVAKEYIDNYFATYAGVRSWMDQVIEEAKERGYVATMLGRRRYVPGLHERNRNIQEAEKRVAINAPIQGTAADLIKIAMLSINKELLQQNLKARQVLQIHDELLLQVPEEEIKQVTELIKTCMMGAASWETSLDVSIRVGKSWGEASK